MSKNRVGLLSFHKPFLETNIAQGLIFKGKRSATIHKSIMDVDPAHKSIGTFTSIIQWYMLESKDTISSICFKLKNENGNLVPFNGQSKKFR